LAEVAEVVKKIFSGKAPGVDEIRPEMLKALDIVGLSLLTCLFSVVWRSGTVSVEWQTRLVVPMYKKGDRRVRSNYQGIILLSFPGKVYSSVLERRQCVFCPSRGTVDQHQSLPIQSICALWTWRRLMTMGNPVGCTAGVWGTVAVGTCHSALVQAK